MLGQFALVLALVLGAGSVALDRELLPAFAPARRYLETLRAAPPPPEGWFVAYDRGGVDQFAIYHDILGTRRPLQEADVIVVGNSRAQAALDPEIVVPYFEGRGLRYYNLAFGHAEHHTLPMAIFERFDLRPRFVLIHVEGFFAPVPLGLAAETLAMSRFDAAKQVFEKNAGFAVRHALHRGLPLVSLAVSSEWIIYRSIAHGSWDIHHTAIQPTVLGPLQYRLRDTPETRRAAERLARRAAPIIDGFRARGSQVVLMEVPATRRNLGSLQALAERVGQPFLDVRLDQVVIVDGSHLGPRSARAFSRAAVAAFEERFPASTPLSGRRGGS